LTIDEIKMKLADIMGAEDYRPMARIALASVMGIPQQDRSEFFSCLRTLESEGVIAISKSKKIKQVKKPHAVTARMLTVTNTGGYAALDDGTGDIFIPRQRLGGAMPTDLIEVRILNRRGRLPEAEVLRISQRNFTEFTGTLTKRGKKAYVTPDSGYKDKIEILHHDVGDAKDKDKVFVRMKTYPDRNGNGTAAVITAYGSAQKASACCEAVLDRRHIRREFQPAVIEEAQKVSKEPLVLTDDRVDLRDEIIFTIDGAHTKDIDDAVSVTKTEEGYRLGVHIADVSHYVRPGSELDKEAYLRGTSIYYADSVIPMLPRELSNGICSLNPQEDRYAFSAVMEIDPDGKVLRSALHKSMIRSRVKGVYEEINRIFEGGADETLREKYHEVIPVLPVMRELAQVLGKAREKRGALDFESGDCEIILDGEGLAEDIRRRERGESEQLIEEFMLCANEAVAKLASEKQIPFVYRVHEEPESVKLEGLSAALRAAGFDTKAIHAGLKPIDLARVLEKIAGSPKEKALNNMVLRSLAKARYSPECLGHFGLALAFYGHFTSPIRRYPDLAIHRILSDLLKNGSESVTKRFRSFADDASEQSSGCELTAMQVEWDCDDIYKAEYMSRHIGETFDGVISSVKSFGMYVELSNSVEGLVRVDKIPGGWFDYDESTLSFYCEKTGVRFSIGDSVHVIAARADVSNGQIDFEII
jgi:ribonuclease R